MAAERPPRVFISYYNEPSLADRVLSLADRLRADGIDAAFDQYETSPPEGWPAWRETQIRDANFVLLVCTEAYCRAFSCEELPDEGQGALWGARLIRQLLYDAASFSTKLVPILYSGGLKAHIPTAVGSATPYVVDTQQGYERLYRQLTNQQETPKPELTRSIRRETTCLAC